MYLFTTVFHVILCVGLILIILLQPGKDSSDIFGGANLNKQSRGASQANPLGKITNGTAIFFMLTSITLAWYSSATARSGSSLEDDIRELEQVLSKEDIEFEIPKLRISASDLWNAPTIPEVPNIVPEGGEVQNDGSDLTPEIPTDTPSISQ
ncbi:MAG: preprotein translocase subunit SecG [Myxococcota bacterium]